MQTITVERVIKSFHQSAKMTANSHNITRKGVATVNPRFYELRAVKGSRIIGKWERTVLEVRQHPSLEGTVKKIISHKLTKVVPFQRPNWMQRIFTKAAEDKIKRALDKSPEVSVKVA